MKKLELNQMENITAGGCSGSAWVGFGIVTLVGIGVIASVATGGAVLPFLLTAAGKFGVAATTSLGIGAIADGC